MTAFLLLEDRAYILNADFQACLLKPFTPDKLLETILTVLRSFRLKPSAFCTGHINVRARPPITIPPFPIRPVDGCPLHPMAVLISKPVRRSEMLRCKVSVPVSPRSLRNRRFLKRDVCFLRFYHPSRYLNANVNPSKKYGNSHLFTASIIENENRIGQRDEKGCREQPIESGFGSKSSSDFHDGASRKGLGVYCPM